MIKHFAKGYQCPSQPTSSLLFYSFYIQDLFIYLSQPNACACHTYIQYTEGEVGPFRKKKGAKVQRVVLSFPASGLPLDHLHMTPHDFFFFPFLIADVG